MTHPTSVRIGRVTYAVTSDPEPYNAAVLEADGGATPYGLTNHFRAQIVLRPELALDVQRMTLWHEILHCCLEVLAGSPDWDEAGLGGTPPQREETAVRTFEHPTLQVLIDNPELQAFLLER